MIIVNVMLTHDDIAYDGGKARFKKALDTEIDRQIKYVPRLKWLKVLFIASIVHFLLFALSALGFIVISGHGNDNYYNNTPLFWYFWGSLSELGFLCIVMLFVEGDFKKLWFAILKYINS